MYAGVFFKTDFDVDNTNLLINMEPTERRMCFKSLKMSRRNLPYYVGHLVVVATVTLPTIFYVLQPDHPPHTDFNE